MKKSIFGGFSDPSFISADDPYEKEEIIPSRYLGANFKVPRCKKGRTPDVFFEKKFLSLASSTQHPKAVQDLYMDPGKRWRLDAKAAKEKNIDKTDFRLASPGKLSTGAGSFFGTFQAKPHPHEADYDVPKKGEAPRRPHPQLPNIKTRPGKKGTYGFIGTTFSKIEPTAEGKADVYDQLRRDETKAWKESKEKIVKISQATFKVTCRTISTFDEKNSRGVTSVYDAYVAPEDKKSKKAKKKPKAEEKILEQKPFKYSSGPKTGEQGFFGKFANTRGEDPDPQKEAPKKGGKDKKAKPEPKALGGPWKPVSGPKTGVIKSLLRRFY